MPSEALFKAKGKIHYVDLHRAADRRAYFSAPSPGVVYDTTLRSWIVDDLALTAAALALPALVTADFKTICEKAAKLGSAVENCRFAFDHVPICLEDESHREMRRAIAEHIALRMPAVSETLPRLLERYLDPFRRPGRIEVMSGVLIPLCGDINNCLLGFDLPDQADCHAISGVFDRLLSIKKSRNLDTRIGEIRSMIRARLGSDWTPQREGISLGLVILGYDPLLGTLGESLSHLFATHSGSPLADIPFPPMPPETGVPYVEREAQEDCRIGPVAVKRGERVRILFQRHAYASAAESQKSMFGVGAHGCLGRRLSLNIWKALSDALRKIDTIVTFVNYQPRTDDYIFTCPKALVVEMKNVA